MAHDDDDGFPQKRDGFEFVARSRTNIPDTPTEVGTDYRLHYELASAGQWSNQITSGARSDLLGHV